MVAMRELNQEWHTWQSETWLDPPDMFIISKILKIFMKLCFKQIKKTLSWQLLLEFRMQLLQLSLKNLDFLQSMHIVWFRSKELEIMNCYKSEILGDTSSGKETGRINQSCGLKNSSSKLTFKSKTMACSGWILKISKHSSKWLISTNITQNSASKTWWLMTSLSLW